MSGPGYAAFQPLLAAEAEIVAALQTGEFDRIGAGSLPEDDEEERAVRAAFLRFLLLGGEEGLRPHEKGIRVRGALVRGVLDLEGCRIPRDIGLRNCRFDAAPVLRSAIIDNLFLDGSDLPGLEADRLEARGTVSLRGAAIAGPVRLPGARLGGNLDANGATIRADKHPAIDAEDLETRSVLLRGATVDGLVRLAGARLIADLEAQGLTVRRPEDVAIDAASIEMRGSVMLQGARVEGAVVLTGGRIGTDLDARDANLSNPGGFALQIPGTHIGGGFSMRGKTRIEGALDLRAAAIGTIHDGRDNWPGPGDLLLDRCRYEAIIDGPLDAADRLDWLGLQDPKRWGYDFWPQPYEHLASIYRGLGHEEDARRVLIAKERRQRRARRARAPNALVRAGLAVVDGVLAVTLLYGRQPLLAFLWLFVFWAVGVAMYVLAAHDGAMKPNSPVVLRSPEWTLCAVPETDSRFLISQRQEMAGLARPGEAQLACFLRQWEASSYPAFNPWMYSLETLFPVIEVDQKTYWRADPSRTTGAIAISFYYFQSTIGWALSLLAVAGFSGLIKSR